MYFADKLAACQRKKSIKEEHEQKKARRTKHDLFLINERAERLVRRPEPTK